MEGLAKIAEEWNGSKEVGHQPENEQTERIHRMEHNKNRQFGSDVVEEWEPGNFISRRWNAMKKRHLQQDLNMTFGDQLDRGLRQDLAPTIGGSIGYVGGIGYGLHHAKDKPVLDRNREATAYGVAGLGLGAGAGLAAKRFIR